MKKLNAEISSKVNRSLVLSEIFHTPLISRAELAEKSGLDRSAITHILNFLIQEGLVEEVCKGDASSRGGRRPILLRVRNEARHLIAIEIGIAQVVGIVTDLQGNEVFRHREPLDRGQSPIDTLTGMINKLLEGFPTAHETLATIGISSPGIVDTEAGVIRLNMYHRWSEVALADELSERFGVTVFIENDANAAALGEMSAIRRKNPIASLVYLFIRESLPGADYPLGVGGSVILRGQLWRGASYCSGEVSKSINESFSEIVHRLGKKRPDLHGATLSELVGRAEEGEGDPQLLLKELAEKLGVLLGHMATFLDPEAVLLYIHPPEKKGFLLKAIDDAFQRHVGSSFRPGIALLQPVLAERATLAGITDLALSKIFIREASTSILIG